MKVLLAEDDLRLGKMLKNILSRQGINAKWVTDGWTVLNCAAFCARKNIRAKF